MCQGAGGQEMANQGISAGKAAVEGRISDRVIPDSWERILEDKVPMKPAARKVKPIEITNWFGDKPGLDGNVSSSQDEDD